MNLNSAVLVAAVIILVAGYGQAQQLDPAALEATIQKLNDTDMLKLFVDLLAGNKDTLHAIRETVLAALPILQFDVPHGWFSKVVIPWALKHLPDVLKNDEILGIADIFITELNRYDQNYDWFPEWVLKSGNKSVALEYMIRGLFGEMNFNKVVADILKFKSVRDFFPFNSTDRQLNERCYADTMAFIDRLLVGEVWALDSKSDTYYEIPD